MTERLSQQLCLSTVDVIADRLGLTERHGPDGGPLMTLTSPMSSEPVGTVRHLRGGVELIYVGLTVEMIGLDSHMMFAFTPADSAVPHFTLDSVRTADMFAFHLDLIPRLDLGAHLAYMDHCFLPLSATRAEASEIAGLSPAQLSPRQWALMSEWMLAFRADESAFREIDRVVAAYRDHWLEMREAGVPTTVVGGVDAGALAARNAANLAAIFDPDVDPVWANVERLIGSERAASVRRLLAAGGTPENGGDRDD